MKKGEKCFIEYHEGVFVGMEDGVYLVDVGDRVLKSKLIPILSESVQEPPPFIKDGRNFCDYSGEKTCWIRDGKLTMVYKYKTHNSFKGYNYFTLEKMEAIDNPFLSIEDIEDSLCEIDKKIRPVKEKIKELQDELRKIEKEKIPIQEKCPHEWELGEEIEGKRDFLGTSISRECECKICGKIEMSYYSRL